MNKEFIEQNLLDKTTTLDSQKPKRNTMSSFKQIVLKELIQDITNEMAIIRGFRDDLSHSRESDWKSRSSRFTELVYENLGKNKLRFYKILNQFFVCTETDEYLGSIELKQIDKDRYRIKNSHRVKDFHKYTSRNFYQSIFPLILSTGIQEILSDIDISQGAFMSYKKLNSIPYLNVSIYDQYEGYLPLSKESLEEYQDRTISIKEQHRFSISQIIERYFKSGVNSDDKLWMMECEFYLEDFKTRVESLGDLDFISNEV